MSSFLASSLGGGSSRVRLVGALALGLLSLQPACVEQNSEMPSEEEIKAAHEHVLTAAPTPKFPVNATLEDKLEYIGMDVDVDEVTPGKAFTLTHYWKVLNPVGDDWKLFIHLEGPDGKKNHLNADHVPIAGKYPLQLWKKGEIIRDIHRVSVPSTWPASTIDFLVGVWKGPLRLKVTSGPKDGENRVKVCTLKVVGAQKEAAKKSIIAKKVKPGTIKPDGKLDEAAWKDAPSTGEFVRTQDGGKADQKATAKLLWDDKFLYVAFEMEDKDVWAKLDKHDDKLWTEEAVEMFIDADGDGKTYVELQANPKGTTFDSYLPTYRKNENDWDANLKVGVSVDGTLENRSDTDKGWIVEMAIPLEAARGKEKTMKNVPPTLGTEWRVNFFRMDLPANRSSIGSAWSPPMVGDFHALARFGSLIFGDEKGQAPVATAMPEGAKPEGAKPEGVKPEGVKDEPVAKSPEKVVDKGEKAVDKAGEKTDKPEPSEEEKSKARTKAATTYRPQQ